LIVLRIVEGTARGRVFELDEPVIGLGRAETNNVAMPDYHLSGEHGQIFAEGDHYVDRDLRSTNGSALQRGEQMYPVDAACGWEITLRDGDCLCLGDPTSPVVALVHLPGERRRARSEDDLGERLIASRSIIDLPAVATRVEHDPASALRIYKALQPLSSRLEMGATLEAVVEATFELLRQATHVTLLLGSDGDKDRFTVALSRERGAGKRHATASDTSNREAVRASRAVLRRVLADRAAVLTANAQEEVASS
jgi:hypothetical protein